MFDKMFRESAEVGMTLDVEQCQFKETELIYLSHKLTVNGKEPDENKIKSILEMPEPEDKKDVWRLLGLINYIGKFIPNLTKLTAPLSKFLVKNKLGQW